MLICHVSAQSVDERMINLHSCYEREGTQIKGHNLEKLEASQEKLTLIANTAPKNV